MVALLFQLMQPHIVPSAALEAVLESTHTHTQHDEPK